MKKLTIWATAALGLTLTGHALAATLGSGTVGALDADVQKMEHHSITVSADTNVFTSYVPAAVTATGKTFSKATTAGDVLASFLIAKGATGSTQCVTNITTNLAGAHALAGGGVNAVEANATTAMTNLTDVTCAAPNEALMVVIKGSANQAANHYLSTATFTTYAP